MGLYIRKVKRQAGRSDYYLVEQVEKVHRRLTPAEVDYYMSLPKDELKSVMKLLLPKEGAV